MPARSAVNDLMVSQNMETESSTEADIGMDLIAERFGHGDEDEASHMVLLSMNGGTNGNFSDTSWIQYQLALTFHLNDTFAALQYTILSNPILAMAGQADLFKLVSDTGREAMLMLSKDVEDLEDTLEDVPDLRDAVKEYDAIVGYEMMVKAMLNMSIPGIFAVPFPTEAEVETIDIYVTGMIANMYDTMESAQEAMERSEVVSIIAVLVILLLVFRSPLGLLIPLLALASCLLLSYGALWVMGTTDLIVVSEFTPSMIAMIGIAVAVDYSLFNIVRFREEYRKRRAKHQAAGTWTKEMIRETCIQGAAITNRTSGKAVAFSGMAVVIGFSALMVTDSPFTKAMALSIAATVAISVLAATTLTPAILSRFGHLLDWPNATTRADRSIEKMNSGKAEDQYGFWHNWSTTVMRRPWTFLIVGLLFMAPFIFLASTTTLSFDMMKMMPPDTEAREGFEIVAEEFNLGTEYPFQVVIDTDTPNGAYDAALIDKINSLALWALDYEDTIDGTHVCFESFNSLSANTNPVSGELTAYSLAEVTAFLDGSNGQEAAAGFIYQTADFCNYGFSNDTLVIELTANLDSGTSIAWKLVAALREHIDEHFDGMDLDVYVTGVAASLSDAKDVLYGDLILMIIIAVVLIFIVLVVLLQSIAIPIKCILTISGSILFALGTLVIVFQEGIGAELIGGEKMSGITYFIPVFIFTVILGLGMDYSIFIVARIREEHLHGRTSEEAVGIGIEKTAGVVTSAASVMIVTFLVFAFSPIQIMQMMGVALAVSIIADVTISRIILLPAAMKLLGDWNWWMPKWLKKIIPKIELKH